jgi:hypothetical protein
VLIELALTFGRLEGNVDADAALSVASYVSAVFDVASLSSSSQAIPYAPQPRIILGGDSFKFLLEGGEFCCSVATDNMMPMFVVSTSLETIAISSGRFPLILTVRRLDSEDDTRLFFTSRVCLKSPSLEIVDFFNRSTGFTLLCPASINNTSQSPSELEVSFTLNEFEVVADKLFLSINAASNFAKRVMLTVFGESEPRPQSDSIAIKQTDDRMNIRSFLVVPNVFIEPSFVWLSSHLQLVTPKIDCHSCSAQKILKCVEVDVNCKRSILLAVVQP